MYIQNIKRFYDAADKSVLFFKDSSFERAANQITADYIAIFKFLSKLSTTSNQSKIFDSF